MNIQEYIEQQQSTTDQHCYILADGAVIDNILEKIYDTEGDPTFYPIYKDTVLEAVIEKTPCLVKAKANSPFLAYLLQEPTEDESWVLLFSQHPLEKLVNHWQSLLYTTLPDTGKEVLFFAYRSKVFKKLIAGSNELEKNRLLGPVAQLLTLDTAEPEIEGWSIWCNAEAWNGQTPEESPWYHLSESQWQHLRKLNRHNTEQAMAEALVISCSNFKGYQARQLLPTVQFWINQAAHYNINESPQIMGLIEVMSYFGGEMPETEFKQLEAGILQNSTCIPEQKIQLLWTYLALIYKRPTIPFDPIRCLAYEYIYYDCQEEEKQLISFDNSTDSTLRSLYLNEYRSLLPNQPTAYQAMKAMYQYFGSQLIINQKYIPVDYLSSQYSIYRDTLQHFFHELLKFQPTVME